MDGNWRGGGVEEIPCEQVREQLRSQRKGMGVERKERAGWGGGGRESKVSAGSTL
jgi:hypothetical protein